jgi:hypothetical protein
MGNASLGSTLAVAVIILFPASIAAAGQGGGGQAPQAPPSNYGGCPVERHAFHKCALQKAKTFNPPRTPEGRPDLQGLWRQGLVHGFSVEGQADPVDPDSVSAPSMVIDPPDGKIPYQPWSAAVGRVGVHYSRFFDPHSSCRHNPPRDTSIGTIYQILQPAGGESVVWIYEESHGYRIIPTDGRPPLGKDIKLWAGSSIGRWEGNTLVIDSANLNGYTWLDDAGNFYSDTARIVERFTMIDPDTIHYQATVEDPKVYTRPFTMAWVFLRDKTPGLHIFEDACREGDRDLPHFLKLGYRPYFGQTWRDRVEGVGP